MRFHKFNRLIIALSALLIIGSHTTNAQLFSTDFLKAGVNDGMKLLEAYIAPYANASGAGFNSAWYNTAKPHKFGGFDITFSIGAGFVPETANEYDLSELNFSQLELVNPSNSIAPTVAGVTTTGPELHVMENLPGVGDVELFRTRTPAGLNWAVVPAPVLQAGIGLPIGSEIKIRYIPNVQIDEFSLKLFGGGFMHSISQHIPGFSLLPLNISVFGGFSKLSGTIPISIKPEAGNMFYSNYDGITDFNDQLFNFALANWNLSLIGSVDVPFVSAFMGIGYGKTSTILGLDGNIPLPTVDPLLSLTGPVYTDAGVVTEVDDITIENHSGLRFNVGGRLKLGVIAFHVEYTYANYNVVTGGFGISFR